MGNSLKKHAIHKLYETRLAQSTKPFKARGGHVQRCPLCRIDANFCMCSLRPETQSDAAFLLLYYDDEILKPSNTGKLIADLIDDTFGFIWKRTDVNETLIDLLNDNQWQPMVIFPEQYAEPGRVFVDLPLTIEDGKRPLFILLDGSWREAKKMFRKSPYLDAFPVLSIKPETASKYQVRKAVRDHQLATAEVAACVLAQYNEPYNAELLQTWFEIFSFRYQEGVKRTNLGDPTAEQRLQVLTGHSAV